MPSRNSIFVDTSGWGSYLDGAEPYHQGVDLVVRQANRNKRRLVTTNHVLNELVVLLSGHLHFDRKRLICVVNELITAPNVDILYIDEAQHRAAWAMLEKYDDKAWSLVDASSSVMMQQYGMTEALTTDHHFTQAGFVRLPVPE